MFFVDGSNWYHSLVGAGLRSLGRLCYPRICDKLAGPGRRWVAMRYYIPDVGAIGDPKLTRDQRRFLGDLVAQDPRISIHMGRLESRHAESEAARALLGYLTRLTIRIAPSVYRELVELGRTHRTTRVFVEKAIDVQIAVDMLELCLGDRYDVAYLLSADGDYTPAVHAVRRHGRRVFSATTAACAQLAAAVDKHIPLDRGWFEDCYAGANTPRGRGPASAG